MKKLMYTLMTILVFTIPIFFATQSIVKNTNNEHPTQEAEQNSVEQVDTDEPETITSTVRINFVNGRVKEDGVTSTILLENDFIIENLDSNELYLEIKPKNDKSYNSFEISIDFNFYNSIDVSDSTITNINNNFVPIYKGTEFSQIKDWLDEEIIWVLNEELYGDNFSKPIDNNDVNIEYSIDDSFIFLEDTITFSYSVTGITDECIGSKEGAVNLQVEDKINKISTYEFNDEVFMTRNEDDLNKITSTTTLEEIKPKLEEEIAYQLNFDNPMVMTSSSKNQNFQEIIVEDLVFDYSISDDARIWEGFEVQVSYKYSPEEQPLNLEFDLMNANNVNSYIVNYSLLLFISLSIFSMGMYYALRKVHKKD